MVTKILTKVGPRHDKPRLTSLVKKKRETRPKDFSQHVKVSVWAGVTDIYHLSSDHRHPPGVPCYRGEAGSPHHRRPVRAPCGW